MSRPRTADYTTFFCENFECDVSRVIRTATYLSRSGHYCSAYCYHSNKKSVKEFVDNCKKCGAEMLDSDKYVLKKASPFCKKCRETKYASALSLKKRRQRVFVVKFNKAWL